MITSLSVWPRALPEWAPWPEREPPRGGAGVIFSTMPGTFKVQGWVPSLKTLRIPKLDGEGWHPVTVTEPFLAPLSFEGAGKGDEIQFGDLLLKIPFFVKEVTEFHTILKGRFNWRKSKTWQKNACFYRACWTALQKKTHRIDESLLKKKQMN